jgi:hypothetical protein
MNNERQNPNLQRIRHGGLVCCDFTEYLQPKEESGLGPQLTERKLGATYADDGHKDKICEELKSR